ncbi:hypothetical protein OIU77_020529 [Salix suchowensis]|uniref:PLATZ transcription factor family protein n=1 Tax=Salix suchowensis TaxID=1278906 RepID=A0ABQ9C6Q7_9ROSI|nr:hypothetical protein OIU77_020529 [Salix suchowensis]
MPHVANPTCSALIAFPMPSASIADQLDTKITLLFKSEDHRITTLLGLLRFKRFLDITGVQTYVINSARVLFLNERPQPKSSTSKGVPHLCEICGRSLLDPFRFCSLGCKLARIKNNGDATCNLGSKDDEVGEMREGRLPSKEEEELRERGQQEMYTSTLTPPNSNSRRRKGTPHRAPFGS